LRSPRHIGSLTLCLLAVVFATALPLQAQKMPASPPREGRRTGDVAFDFTLKDLDGKPHRLKDLRGRVVHVVFWATWCMPCLEEMPDLKEAYERYHDRGLEILGVVVPMSQTPEGVRAFAQKQALRYPILWDDGMALMSRYNVDSIPRNFVIDRQGVIRYAGVALPERYDDLIEHSLKGSATPASGS
jgi:peroxiredoxin